MENHHKKIIFFDSDCLFCSKMVQFIYDNDKKELFYFAALSSSLGKEISKKYGLKEIAPDTFIYYDGKICLIKSDAALYVLSRLRKPWGIIKVFYIVPHPIRNWVYDMVANHRHRIYKNNASCGLPDALLKKRTIQ